MRRAHLAVEARKRPQCSSLRLVVVGGLEGAEGERHSRQLTRGAIAEVRPGECCGEIALLAGRETHSKDVTCAAERCTLVTVRGDDFLRLVRKSQAVRESFEHLSRRRSEENQESAAKS